MLHIITGMPLALAHIYMHAYSYCAYHCFTNGAFVLLIKTRFKAICRAWAPESCYFQWAHLRAAMAAARLNTVVRDAGICMGILDACETPTVAKRKSLHQAQLMLSLCLHSLAPQNSFEMDSRLIFLGQDSGVQYALSPPRQLSVEAHVKYDLVVVS